MLKKKIIDFFTFLRFIYAKMFACFFYDKKYLKGKYFSNGFRSIGWQWAATDISYRMKTLQHIGVKFPVSPQTCVTMDTEFDPDDLNNMNGMGCYFQTIDAKIKIGKGTYIANNVGIITTNHDVNDIEKHAKGKDVIIGKKCWIGMNSMILPGVVLGDGTVVGAGSVVTKSFEQGHCVIAGNPARLIRILETNKNDIGEKE